MNHYLDNSLNTNFIPYEIRRNPIKMFNMNDIYYSNNKFYSLHYPKEFDKLFSTNINNNLTYKIVETPVIIFFEYLSYLNNYGHFILDNLIPIFKTICTYKQNLYPDNQIILYLYRDTDNPLNEKWKILLECFVSKVEYFDTNILFKKAIITVQSFIPPWKSKLNNSINNVIFFNNFIDIIYKKFNIVKNNEPTEINFLSRYGAKWRRILNENDIPYKKITFENLTINEEIEKMNNTKILITPYGAGLVSGFFLNKNSTIIIIYPPNFSYTRDCSTMELYFLQKLGIKTICCDNNCEIVKDIVIYENNITNNNNIKYRDKDFEINIEKLEEIINNLL